jgi:hypothetical protein
LKLQSEESLADAAVSAKDAFLKKTRRIDRPKITLGDQTYTLEIHALTNKELNTLIDEHPARKNNDEDKPYGYNRTTLPPALFAMSVKDPQMTREEWEQVWISPEWSPGELSHLLDLVMSTSTRGFDVPFGARS